MGDKIPSVASLSAHILAAIAKPRGGPSLSDLGRHKKWFYPFSLNFSANLKQRLLCLQNLPMRHPPPTAKLIFFSPPSNLAFIFFREVLPVFLGLVYIGKQPGKQKPLRPPIEVTFSWGNTV